MQVLSLPPATYYKQVTAQAFIVLCKVFKLVTEAWTHLKLVTKLLHHGQTPGIDQILARVHCKLSLSVCTDSSTQKAIKQDILQ